ISAVKQKDFILRYEFLNCRNSLHGIAGVILDDQLKLAAVDSAMFVDVFVNRGRTVYCLCGDARGAGNRPKKPNLYALVTDAGPVGGSGCRSEYYRKDGNA